MSRAGDRHFEEFQGHTRLKHLVLRKYVGAWAAKLRRGGDVWFIDAFAGEGSDRAGNPGSPLIAAQLAAAFPPDGLGVMRILAIEKVPERCDRLQANLRPYVETKIAHVRCGTLEERIDRVMAHIDGEPALFFLDPFGVEGLLVDLLPKLLSGPQNEVFALFADVGANRLHAVLMAEGRDPDSEEAAIRAAPSLFEEWTEADASRARAEAEKSRKSLRATQDASERILIEALGPAALVEIERVPEADRRDWMARRFMQALRDAGAAYVLSLPVRDESSQRAYQLVYATKSAVGLRAMKEAMDSALRHAPLPEESIESMRAELRGNEDAVAAELARHFAGREVRWTEGKDRGKTDTVRRYLLEHTAIFPMQFDAVKQRLADAGFVVAKRPLTFRFPPAPPPAP